MIGNLLKRIKMYVMISAIEEDFLNNFSSKLTLQDLPEIVKAKAQQNNLNKNNIEDILRALDLQSYIEIFNNNILKLKASKDEKEFLNKDLVKIIGIRNKIMHPRLLEFYDFSILNECFSEIDKKIPKFSWNCVIDARENILPNNEELIKLENKINLKKSSTVIENLPQDVEFEETSFIGRKKEIGEIKEKLFKKNVHILSIIGEGGIGKTSTTIKLLYDLLDDNTQPFNLILWISLKTRTLNNYEFENIENAITSTASMYEQLNKVVGCEKNNYNIKDYLINLTKDFNILLILDNLETINSEEIKDFLSKFTENAKVIITSRISLGEMETTYKLTGLNDDDLLNYIDTLLDLYGCSNYFTKQEKLNYAKDELHSNPLAIKWFVRTLSANKDKKNIKDLFEHKDELINFCMSNVYEQLSDDAKSLLNIISILNKPLTIGELFYYMEAEDGNELKIRQAINDLIKSSFIEQSLYNEDSLISISDFAKEFLMKIEKTENFKLQSKQKALFAFEQDLVTDYNTDPYNIKNFIVNSSERHKIISSFYLREAINYYHKKDLVKTNILLDLARRISPNFYACNIVSAFLNASTNPQTSMEEYKIAIENSKGINETRMIYIHCAKFLLSTNDYNGAITKLEKAELIKTDYYTIFEKTKVLACCGRFDEAYTSINRINFEEIKNNIKLRNLYYLRLSDIKRREAERIDNRNISKKIDKYIECLQILNNENEPEDETINFVALILKDLFYLIHSKQVLLIIYENIEKYKYKIFKVQNFKILKKMINQEKDNLPDFEEKHELLKYVFDINSELVNLEENEAIVSNVKEYFGFVKNLKYPQGIYFSKYNLNFEPQLGDIVELGEVIESKQGFTTLNIKYKNNIFSKYNI